MLTNSLPLKMEMMSVRGWSSNSWMDSARGFFSRRSCCRSSRESENSAVSELEKNAEHSSKNTCNPSRASIPGSASSALSNASSVATSAPTAASAG